MSTARADGAPPPAECCSEIGADSQTQPYTVGGPVLAQDGRKTWMVLRRAPADTWRAVSEHLSPAGAYAEAARLQAGD